MKKGFSKGFSMIEVIVVMAILGLLMALAGGGMSHYVRNMTMQKNNETARCIYLAASKALGQKKANGALQSWWEETQKEAVPLSNQNVEPALPEESWLKLRLASANTDGERERLYALLMNPSDSDSALGQLLEYYLPAGFLDSEADAVCVEFCPGSGQVYAVFYSGQGAAFQYGTAQPEADSLCLGNASLRTRAEETRRDFSLGYYNAEVLGEPEPDQ